jgi:hypothetical protein
VCPPRHTHRPRLEFLCSYADFSKFLFAAADMLCTSGERNLPMTTILILNAASSLLGLVGVAGFLAFRERRARRQAGVQVLYVTTGRARRLPHS